MVASGPRPPKKTACRPDHHGLVFLLGQIATSIRPCMTSGLVACILFLMLAIRGPGRPASGARRLQFDRGHYGRLPVRQAGLASNFSGEKLSFVDGRYGDSLRIFFDAGLPGPSRPYAAGRTGQGLLGIGQRRCSICRRRCLPAIFRDFRPARHMPQFEGAP